MSSSHRACCRPVAHLQIPVFPGLQPPAPPWKDSVDDLVALGSRIPQEKNNLATHKPLSKALSSHDTDSPMRGQAHVNSMLIRKSGKRSRKGIRRSLFGMMSSSLGVLCALRSVMHTICQQACCLSVTKHVDRCPEGRFRSI